MHVPAFLRRLMGRTAVSVLTVLVMMVVVVTPVLAVVYDNGNRAMEVSLYGKTTVAGDTALVVDAGTTGLKVYIAGSAAAGDSVNVTQVASTAVQSGGISNVAPTAGMLDVLIACRYNSSNPTLTSTRVSTAQCGVDGSQYVSGGVASGVADVGNPVKVGGVYSSTLPTFTNGQRGDIQLDTRGSIHAAIWNADGTVGATVQNPSVDAVVTTTTSLGTIGFPYGFNGTTWDRNRSIINATNSTGTGIQSVGLVAQVDDTSPTTITENQFGNVRMSPARGLYVEPGPFAYAYIAAGQATTVVKGSPGFLHNVCFNSAATAANVTTIYDNASTSGTIIAIPNAVAATVPNCVTYDVTATLGIVIITTTQNGANMTVSYR